MFHVDASAPTHPSRLPNPSLSLRGIPLLPFLPSAPLSSAMASSSSPSSPPASPSDSNPNPHADADPRSDPSMPAASGGDGASPGSPEQQDEAEAAPPEKEEQEPPEPAEEAPTPRKTRLPRSCNSKTRPPPPPPLERPRRRAAAGAAANETPQCRVVTPLVSEPEAPAELPRWRLRCMWELGSVLNFLHVRAPFPPSLSLELPPVAGSSASSVVSPVGLSELRVRV
jgi:hypothetical protein